MRGDGLRWRRPSCSLIVESDIHCEPQVFAGQIKAKPMCQDIREAYGLRRKVGIRYLDHRTATEADTGRKQLLEAPPAAAGCDGEGPAIEEPAFMESKLFSSRNYRRQVPIRGAAENYPQRDFGANLKTIDPVAERSQLRSEVSSSAALTGVSIHHYPTESETRFCLFIHGDAIEAGKAGPQSWSSITEDDLPVPAMFSQFPNAESLGRIVEPLTKVELAAA